MLLKACSVWGCKACWDSMEGVCREQTSSSVVHGARWKQRLVSPLNFPKSAGKWANKQSGCSEVKCSVCASRYDEFMKWN